MSGGVRRVSATQQATEGTGEALEGGAARGRAQGASYATGSSSTVTGRWSELPM